MDLSVIVPVLNEERSIVSVLNSIKQTMGSCEHGYEIIVVDDGSTDKTYELAVSQGVKVIRHTNNRGYGASLKGGLSMNWKKASKSWKTH